MSDGLRAFGMAVVGTAAGAHIDSEVLGTVARQPVAVIGGVLATLAVTMLVGQLLRLDRDVDGATAAFASIAGGASGVAMAAREFGADDAVVMSVQYLRVVLVLVSVPLVAPLLGDAGGAALPAAGSVDLVSQHLFTLCAVVLGLGAARVVRFSAAPILWTLVVSSVIAVSGVFPDARVPGWVLAVGYAVVGANVGLSFTSDRLRRLARILPLALVQCLLGIGLCALVGVFFARALGISQIDGYLATTPGGLPAVVAVAVDSGQEIGLILTMQFVRVFISLAFAPVLGWALSRRRPTPEG
jgi:membrane AbrB-like protein